MTPLPATDDAPIVVIEPEPFWGPELQRRFPQRRVSINPGWSRCDPPELEAAALIVAEGSALLAELTLFSARRRSAGSRATPLVAILRRSQRRWEWPLRELGADAVLDEFSGGANVAATCERLLAGSPAAQVRPV